jgi:hypothetical protein
VVGTGVAAIADAAGCAPRELAAAIGPAIGPCCYEVGDEVAAAIARAAGSDEVVLHGDEGAKPVVDLRRAVALCLEAAGLARDRVEVVGPCTRCSTGLLHSYRRDGPRSGRQLGVIAILPSG